MKKFYHKDSMFSRATIDDMRSFLPSWPKKKEAVNSIYALMEDGSMKGNSLSRVLYNKLVKAFNDKYEDNPDREALLSAMTANYQIEVESAWQSFMAEIGETGD